MTACNEAGDSQANQECSWKNHTWSKDETAEDVVQTQDQLQGQ